MLACLLGFAWLCLALLGFAWLRLALLGLLCLLACFLASLLPRFLASLLPCLLACFLPCVRACALACLLAWLDGWMDGWMDSVNRGGRGCGGRGGDSPQCKPSMDRTAIRENTELCGLVAWFVGCLVCWTVRWLGRFVAWLVGRLVGTPLMDGWMDPVLPHVPEASGSVSGVSRRSGQSLRSFRRVSKG